jgi:hypothetical protein
MARTMKKNKMRELAEELDTFDTMLATLIELLERKGILTQSEYETKLKTNLEKKMRLKSYRDVEDT